MKDSVLGVLPARAGSKGLPGKNLKWLAGRPLVQWAGSALAGAASVSRKVCSTDSPEIAAEARAVGLEVPFLRPKRLAEDDSMIRDVLIHTLQQMQQLSEQEYQYVVLVQATSPTVTTGDVEKALHLAKSQNLSAVITAQLVPPDFHPAVTFVESDRGRVDWSFGEGAATQRRQDWPRTFARCGLVYVFDSHQLLYGDNLYGTKVGYLEVSADRAIGIDSQADFDVAETYFAALADEGEGRWLRDSTMS